MTYHNAYTLIASAGNSVTGLTMYEACKALRVIATAGKLQDITHVRRGTRPVAFFSEWRGTVTPMSTADAGEREVLTAWA